jgi:integrase
MKGTIRFELKKGVKGKHGKLPISMIYSVIGKRVRLSTGVTIHEIYWDQANQAVNYIPIKNAKKLLPDVNPHLLLTEGAVIDINHILSVIKTKVGSIENRFKATDVTFTSKMVVDALTSSQQQVAKAEEPKELLFDFMEKYILDHTSTRVKGSLTVYKSVLNHLKAYQDATRDRVRFDSIDYAFFQRFQTFLIHREKVDIKGNRSPMLNNTTIAKALSTLKTFLNYAKMQGVKVNDGYGAFVIKKEKLEVIALEQEEFDAILKLDLSDNLRLDRARDLFCFSCATGLRYSDVAQLSRAHIKGHLIELIITKTKTELTIPLNPISWEILKKYEGNERPLPVISNQNLNYYIKEVCELAGINSPQEIVRYRGVKKEVVIYPKFELIHFHTGRKTFCTLSLEKGMSAEEVMETSGHSDYRSFKRYVNITEKRKVVVMRKSWGAIPDANFD